MAVGIHLQRGSLSSVLERQKGWASRAVYKSSVRAWHNQTHRMAVETPVPCSWLACSSVHALLQFAPGQDNTFFCSKEK